MINWKDFKINTKAPIALFCYNRLAHVKKVFSSLENNSEFSESKLFVYIDGPRSDTDLEKGNEIESFFHSVNNSGQIQIYRSKMNLGLSKSIKSGITKTLSEFSKVIVLEDDIVVSRFFLQFMNEGLDHYENQNSVASIHGYLYPLKKKFDKPFFIRGSDCWGWATWRRAWKLYNDDGEELYNSILNQNLQEHFDFNGRGGYMNMLKDQIIGVNDSWAVKWYASTYLNQMLTLYPNISLVKNIGFDGTGYHSNCTNSYLTELSELRINPKNIPIEENLIARREFEKFFKSLTNWSININVLKGMLFSLSRRIKTKNGQ